MLTDLSVARTRHADGTPRAIVLWRDDTHRTDYRPLAWLGTLDDPAVLTWLPCPRLMQRTGKQLVERFREDFPDHFPCPEPTIESIGAALRIELIRLAEAELVQPDTGRSRPGKREAVEVLLSHLSPSPVDRAATPLQASPKTPEPHVPSAIARALHDAVWSELSYRAAAKGSIENLPERIARKWRGEGRKPVDAPGWLAAIPRGLARWGEQPYAHRLRTPRRPCPPLDNWPDDPMQVTMQHAADLATWLDREVDIYMASRWEPGTQGIDGLHSRYVALRGHRYSPTDDGTGFNEGPLWSSLDEFRRALFEARELVGLS